MRCVDVSTVCAAALLMVGTPLCTEARSRAYATGDTRVWILDPTQQRIVDSTATDTFKNLDSFYGQDPKTIDFEYDVKIGLNNVTAYLAAGGRATGVLFFDTARGVLEGSLPLTSAPWSISLTPGDRLALLTLPQDRTVAVVDLASRSVAGYIPIGEPVYRVDASRTCTGDCGSSGDVSISELVQGVNIALGLAEIHGCPSGDRDADGQVGIDELGAAVGNALEGC